MTTSAVCVLLIASGQYELQCMWRGGLALSALKDVRFCWTLFLRTTIPNLTTATLQLSQARLDGYSHQLLYPACWGNLQRVSHKDRSTSWFTVLLKIPLRCRQKLTGFVWRMLLREVKEWSSHFEIHCFKLQFMVKLCYGFHLPFLSLCSILAPRAISTDTSSSCPPAHARVSAVSWLLSVFTDRKEKEADSQKLKIKRTLVFLQQY